MELSSRWHRAMMRRAHDAERRRLDDDLEIATIIEDVAGLKVIAAKAADLVDRRRAALRAAADTGDLVAGAELQLLEQLAERARTALEAATP